MIPLPAVVPAATTWWRICRAREAFGNGILAAALPKEPVPALPPPPISGRDHLLQDIAQKRRASSFSTAGLRLAVC
jgi:hypothetical protein